MPVPSNFTSLSAVSTSNPPTGGEGPSEGDDHIRQIYAFLASIAGNTGNGWTSPYLPNAGGTVTGPVAFNAATSGQVVGGTYTATITNNFGLNAGGSVGPHFYARIGQFGIVFGSCTRSPNNTSSAGFNISLPVAQPSGTCEAIGGGAAQLANVVNSSIEVVGDNLLPRANLTIQSPFTGSQQFRYWFAYRVI